MRRQAHDPGREVTMALVHFYTPSRSCSRAPRRGGIPLLVQELSRLSFEKRTSTAKNLRHVFDDVA